MLLVDSGADGSKTFDRLSAGARSGKYVLDRVTTFQDGIRDAVADGHDVYVVDHHVGSGSGFDFLAWAQAERLRIPIVFVAGDHRTGMSAVRSGASCYIVDEFIDSGFLDASLTHALSQAVELRRLGSAGIDVDRNTVAGAQVLVDVAGRLRETSTALSETVRRSLHSELPGPALESFGSIERRAHALLTLANDLYDLSLLDAGHLEFDTAAFSLRSLVSTVTQQPLPLGERRIETVVEVASDVPDALAGDPGRVRRLIASFVEAVALSGSADTVAVTVEVDRRTADGVTLRFDVRGAGTDGTAITTTQSHAEDLTRALALDRSKIGTKVALETVSRMGGSVTLARESDDAVRIAFTILLAIREDDTQVPSDVEVREATDRTILVIADEIDSRRSIVEAIGDTGYPYLAVRSVEAWAAAMSLDDDSAFPELVVIDSSVNSFAVCDEFQQIAPSVPIVIVTADGKRGDAVRCRERGVRGYLAKPTDPGDLSDVIKWTMKVLAAGDTTTLVTRHWIREGRVSLHVLVVDDSTTARFLLTRMLEQRGHSTSQARDGEEAIAAIRAGSYDVVLMDLVMPEMDGIEATARIREMNADTGSRPRIIGMSAFSDGDNIDSAEGAGMDGFLAKPILPSDVFRVVERPQRTESPAAAR